MLNQAHLEEQIRIKDARIAALERLLKSSLVRREFTEGSDTPVN